MKLNKLNRYLLGLFVGLTLCAGTAQAVVQKVMQQGLCYFAKYNHLPAASWKLDYDKDGNVVIEFWIGGVHMAEDFKPRYVQNGNIMLEKGDDKVSLPRLALKKVSKIVLGTGEDVVLEVEHEKKAASMLTEENIVSLEIDSKANIKNMAIPQAWILTYKDKVGALLNHHADIICDVGSSADPEVGLYHPEKGLYAPKPDIEKGSEGKE